MTDKPASPRRARSAAAGAGPSAEVESFLAALEHPLKREILRLRAVILGADPRITESIKWNAPSFATSEHFATFHLRSRGAVQIVLHRGARPRRDVRLRESIADPASLLDWRGADRAIVTFHDLAEIEAARTAFVGIIRRWVRFV